MMLDLLRETAVQILETVESLNRDSSVRVSHSTSLYENVERFEKSLINAALRTAGNQARAARMLDLKQSTLQWKMRRYGIETAPRLKEVSK